jgi:lipopolysaccharide/colanic/teichoic acid biosynthesis glycosyltransferase
MAPQNKPIKFLLIGATGFVGKQLVPALARRGHSVMLMPKTARGVDINRDEWAAAIANADVIVLLSVINNDQMSGSDEMRAVNVELPLTLIQMIPKRTAKRIVLFGSDLTDSVKREDPYTNSKRELIEALAAYPAAPVSVLILSPVHGEFFVKRLSFVDNFPTFMRNAIINSIGAFRPLTHIDNIVTALEWVSTESQDSQSHKHVYDKQNNNLVYRMLTRSIDLFVAFVVLTLFSWLLVIIAVLIAATSAGPALFRQERVGRIGQVFVCYKFRTMRVGTPQVATHQVSAISMTSIGKLLRATKLDELPQMINVIANDMSLVGPRPCLPSQHELIAARNKLGVFEVKPGITGLAQIRGIDMSEPERLAEEDSEYCARQSIPLYLKILFFTVIGRGMGDRVKRPVQN